jgi:1-phosphofructokinase
MQALPWLIKPNVEELHEAFPSATVQTWQAKAAALYDAGVANVVVSNGAAGVVWWSKHGVWSAVPPQVTVRSTVGAGDALVAGMLHGLLTDAAAPEVLRQATACGAYAVTQIGFGLTDKTRLQEIARQVQVQAINPA